MSADRYFVDSDSDGHWFLVPAEHRTAWNAWTELDQDTEAAWTPPEWAVALDGHPSHITFEAPTPS